MKKENELENLLKEDNLDELYKTLDYLIDVRVEASNENYKIKKFYDDWITKFEKKIDNTKEKNRLNKQRELIFK